MTAVVASSMDVDASASTGLRAYYDAKIEALSVALRDKTQNLRRLEAQRNELNGRGGRGRCGG
jgi:26S proteasome regulatory subunit T6